MSALFAWQFHNILAPSDPLSLNNENFNEKCTDLTIQLEFP